MSVIVLSFIARFQMLRCIHVHEYKTHHQVVPRWVSFSNKITRQRAAYVFPFWTLLKIIQSSRDVLVTKRETSNSVLVLVISILQNTFRINPLKTHNYPLRWIFLPPLLWQWLFKIPVWWMECRALHMIGKHSITQLHAQPTTNFILYKSIGVRYHNVTIQC